MHALVHIALHDAAERLYRVYLDAHRVSFCPGNLKYKMELANRLGFKDMGVWHGSQPGAQLQQQYVALPQGALGKPVRQDASLAWDHIFHLSVGLIRLKLSMSHCTTLRCYGSKCSSRCMTRAFQQTGCHRVSSRRQRVKPQGLQALFALQAQWRGMLDGRDGADHA